MSKIYASKNLSIADAECLIRNEYGNAILTRKNYPSDNLTLWFVGEPDKYFQHYIAEMGAANLVIADNETVIS